MLAATLLWSSSAIFARAPLFDAWPEDSRGAMLAFWRAVFAAAVLAPTIRRPRFRWLLVPLTVCFALMNVSYLTSMVRTSPANAIWLQAAAPWWVFLISVVFLRAPVVRRDLTPLLFGAAGVGVILAMEWIHTPGQDKTGILAGLLSGLMYACVVLLMGQLRKENSAWIIALNHAVAALVLAPWMLYVGCWPSLGQLAVLAAFGALQMGVPYAMFHRALRWISPQEAVAITLLEPVLTPLWAYLVWGVGASWWTFLGAALILTGLLLRYVVWEWLAPSR